MYKFDMTNDILDWTHIFRFFLWQHHDVADSVDPKQVLMILSELVHISRNDPMIWNFSHQFWKSVAQILLNVCYAWICVFVCTLSEDLYTDVPNQKKADTEWVHRHTFNHVYSFYLGVLVAFF